MFNNQTTISNNPKSSFPSSLIVPTQIKNIIQAQPPLISVKKINGFRLLLAKAALGKLFLIQTSDGLGNLYEAAPESTWEQFNLIQQLAQFFQRKTGCDVIRVGQLVEPNPLDLSLNDKIYSDFGCRSGSSEPWHMLLGYNCRASLHREINEWNRGWESEQKIYTSSETISLDYEQALTRLDKRSGLYYNLATHFPLLRTAGVEHFKDVSYLKKIANPIALKIGSDVSISELVKNLDILDPHHIPGRISLIPSLGIQSIDHILPQLITAVNNSKRTVLWSCDPLQANTETLSSGLKIRRLCDVVEEIKQSFLIHRTMGSRLNAIYLKATHLDVLECLDYQSLPSKEGFKNLMDPRLNYVQAMHVMQCVTKEYFNH